MEQSTVRTSDGRSGQKPITLAMRNSTRVRLEALSTLLQKPAWKVVERSLMTLLESLPQEDRNAVEVLARRAELNSSLQSSATGGIGQMQSSKTVEGAPFSYTGSLDSGLVVHHEKSTTRISAETIQRIRDEIESRQGPMKMGACNKPLIPDSVGEAMNVRYKTAPQNLSYVVPLLEEQGVIATRKEGRYWMICRR